MCNKNIIKNVLWRNYSSIRNYVYNNDDLLSDPMNDNRQYKPSDNIVFSCSIIIELCIFIKIKQSTIKTFYNENISAPF